MHVLADQEWSRPTGTLPPYAIRDRGLLLSTLAQPFQTQHGQSLYPSVTLKGACLFRGLVKNHPLVDGNKRVAVTAMTLFLQINGREPTYSNEQLYRYALRVAGSHGNYRLDLIDRWLRRNSVPVDRGLVVSFIMDLFSIWQDPEWTTAVMLGDTVAATMEP